MKYPEVISVGEPLVEFIPIQAGTSLSESTKLQKCPAGGAAVFAVAVARLGVSCGLIGNVGDDEFGDYLTNVLKVEGVEVSGITKKKGFQTGLAFTSYDKTGRRKYLYYRKDSPGTQLSRNDIDTAYLSKARVLHFPGTTLVASPSSKDAMLKAVKMAQKNGMLISFDPNIRTEMMSIGKIRQVYNEFWPFCDLITPGEEEINLLTECDSLEKGTRKLLRKGVKIVAVTLGDRGCLIATKEVVFRSPALKVKAIDPTGAGDTFNAAFVVGLLAGSDLKEIANFSNAAASVTVQKVGHISYALPTRKNVDKLLSAVK